MRRVHRCRLAGVGELAGRVLPQRLQHAVPGVAAGLVGDDQRLPNQPLQQLQHPLRGQLGVGDHRLGRGQGPPAAEHRQPAEQHPLLPGEQVVAPVHRVPQGPLPGLGGAVAGGQHREPVPHPVGQLERAAVRPAGPPPAPGPAECRPAGGRSPRPHRERARPRSGRGAPRPRGPGTAGPPGTPGPARMGVSCGGTGSGPTGSCTSPGTASASRLVARIRTPGQRSRMACTSPATGSIRCSQLSSTISMSRRCQLGDEHIPRPVGHRSALDASTPTRRRPHGRACPVP